MRLCSIASLRPIRAGASRTTLPLGTSWITPITASSSRGQRGVIAAPADWLDEAQRAAARSQPDSAWGAYVALGPIASDSQAAAVGVQFYGGHRWARWMRYHLERADGVWRVTRAQVMAVS
jgi:hypothetical protein